MHGCCLDVRLSPTARANRFFASRWTLCLEERRSNRRGSGRSIFLREERGEPKMNRLSPPMHFSAGRLAAAAGEIGGGRGPRARLAAPCFTCSGRGAPVAGRPPPPGPRAPAAGSGGGADEGEKGGEGVAPAADGVEGWVAAEEEGRRWRRRWKRFCIRLLERRVFAGALQILCAMQTPGCIAHFATCCWSRS